jgi:hypothetical protein
MKIYKNINNFKISKHICVLKLNIYLKFLKKIYLLIFKK